MFDPVPASPPTEVVTRPEPGLARGLWEAPAWAFWVGLAAALGLAGAYLLYRLGLVRIKRGSR
jgi:hypothetical protein